MKFMDLFPRRAAVAAVVGLTIVAASPDAKATQQAFFEADGELTGLWVTDGTPAGTIEIPAPSTALAGCFFCVNDAGPDLTFLNGNMLLVAHDNAGRKGLWLTNGTQSATNELVIPGVPADGIFDPAEYVPDFTTLGNRALFNGKDAATGNTHLWTTDGTVAGTSELIPPGTGSSGFSFSNSVTANGKAFFISGGQLWASDGTANGTAPIVAAGFNGLLSHPFLKAFDNGVIFLGADKNNVRNIWTSDGTSAGTVEIPPVPTGGPLFAGNDPQIVRLGGKIIFAANDSNNHGSAWVTDGTAEGTIELMPTAGYSGGLLSGISPQFVVFNNRVYFSGIDDFGIPSLFSTDGTTAGTAEIPVNSASTTGIFSGFDENPNFIVVGNKLLFVGRDSSDDYNLYASDGTTAGTQELLIPSARSGGLDPQGITSDGKFALLNGKALFLGTLPINNSLYVTDGTVAGTVPLGPRDPFGFSLLAPLPSGPLPTLVASAVAPASRSVQVPGPATVFATVLNISNGQLTNCQLTLSPGAPSSLSLSYQATDSATNAPIGQPNTPVTIAAGGFQTFVLSFGSSAPLTDPGQAISYGCDGTSQASTVVGVNTVDLLFSATPIPDVIALAATATNDLTIHLSNDIGAFGVASINVGAAGDLTVSTDTGSATLPISVTLCQTTATAQCMAPPAASVPVTFAAGAVPTFSIFVSASAQVPFAPGASRIFVRFKDGSGVSHGATSVAVTTN